jgi:predicted PurR-regulated permease PerM
MARPAPIVLLPLAFLTASLVSEGAGFYARMESGELDFGRYFDQIMHALPSWFIERLNQFGLGNVAALKLKLSTALSQGASLIATQALSIGQNTFEFIVNFFITIYLVFFLLLQDMLQPYGMLMRIETHAHPYSEWQVICSRVLVATR